MTKNKKVLGIVIPYYVNSKECETRFKKLMQEIRTQLLENIILVVVEDGQCSDWLKEYQSENIKIISNKKNQGVSHARNVGLDYLIDKVNYITFIDSDDEIANDYLAVMYDYCADNTHDVIETMVQVNDEKVDKFDKDRMRNAVWGVAIKTKIIGDKRFKEDMQIAEDVDFIKNVVDLTKHRKKQCNTIYHYKWGSNPCSLTKLYNEKKIDKYRSDN